MDNAKNRKEIRRTLMIYLDCIDMKTEEEAGKIVDITNEGFLLMAERPLQIGKGSNYRIILPNIEVFSGVKLQAEGICRWVRKDELQELYYMGISFLKPNPDHPAVIELLINKLGFSDGQKKIFTAAGEIEYK